MADITDQHDQGSPSGLDEHTLGNGGEPRGVKRSRQAAADDDDDDDDKPGRERRKIEIKFITDKSRRHITFSKRKAGIMKKVCAITRRVAMSSSRMLEPILTISRLTNYPSLLAPRCSSSLSPRQVLYTHSQHQSCSHW